MESGSGLKMFHLDMSFIIGMEKQAQVTYEAGLDVKKMRNSSSGEEECRRKGRHPKRAGTWRGCRTSQVQGRVTWSEMHGSDG